MTYQLSGTIIGKCGLISLLPRCPYISNDTAEDLVRGYSLELGLFRKGMNAENGLVLPELIIEFSEHIGLASLMKKYIKTAMK
jgi:hypothetical protein